MEKNSNFSFLKNIDSELFETIKDAEKLFQDEYFSQAAVQLRIFCEAVAKKVLKATEPNIHYGEMTFDNVINCLKDKAKTDIEREFVEDLFFIKREGNKCAHGETINSKDILEAFERVFEVSITYVNYFKKVGNRDDKGNKIEQEFDKTLLITGKKSSGETLAKKYLKAAKVLKDEEKEEKRAQKLIEKEIREKIKNEVKEKGKIARKNLKENVNNIKPVKKISKEQNKPGKINKLGKPKKPNKLNKQNKPKKQGCNTSNISIDKGFLRAILFIFLTIISIVLIFKIIIPTP